MLSLTPEQILVISVVSVWFLFPLGMLVSFIRQSNEEHAPTRIRTMTAGDIAHSPAYAPEVDEDVDDDEFIPSSIPAYQIPKTNQNSNNYTPKV
ncbi:MAG: hypothetical protein H7177_02300 [Rhizobacter sp.]|nr:hypothetical protein [Bacteriovorax sp.]